MAAKIGVTELVKHKVVRQGAIMVNNVIYYKKSRNIITVVIDTKSKRGEVFSVGNDEKNAPVIDLEATKNTVKIMKGKTIEDITEVSFPELKGWSIFSCMYCKYSVYICLTK